jgi:hypothetical protein
MRHVNLRNAYTHRNAKCDSSKLPQGEQLLWHTEGVLLLGYAAILYHLGFSQHEIKAVFDESHFQWFKICRVKELNAQ